MGDCFALKPQEMPTNLKHTNLFKQNNLPQWELPLWLLQGLTEADTLGSLDPVLQVSAPDKPCSGQHYCSPCLSFWFNNLLNILNKTLTATTVTTLATTRLTRS
jgi:hypothetical protein